MSQGAAATSATGGEVKLGRSIHLYPGEPLPAFNRPTAPAYAAQDQSDTARALFALVSGEELLPRVNVLTALSRLRAMPLVVPVEWGVVDWPAAGAKRYAVVYERPEGRPLLESPRAKAKPMDEDSVVRRVLRPLIPVFKELDQHGLSHRAISADNVFAAEAGGPVVLGECASAPPGLLQPLVYETIEAGQAMPAGRGTNGSADDLYAFGVLLVVLLRGGDPWVEADPEELVSAKINKGSYAALMDQTRVSLTLMEPLRGLLCDDPAERWTVGELELWANGRTLSPKQAIVPAKSRRPFPFAEREHWNCRSLSLAMHRHWEEALNRLRDGSLEPWIRRSIADEDHAKVVLKALTSGGAAPGASAESDDRLLTRVLAALDPEAPLRYRDFAARPHALPQVLAVNWHDEAQRQRFADLINARLPQQWLEVHEDAADLLETFEKLRFYVTRQQIGYGLERCLYEFNPGWPCQSPLTHGRYVCEMAQLLPALETNAEGGVGDREPVDRHIAAFCAARIRPTPERALQTLADPPDEASRRLAMLRLLSDVQRQYGPHHVPHLAGWLAGLLEPVIETYHNRRFRERLRETIQRTVEGGDLSQLLFVVDNIEARDRDKRGFEAARREYAELARHVNWLQQGGLTSRAHVTRMSRNAATAISALLAGVMLVMLTVYHVT